MRRFLGREGFRGRHRRRAAPRGLQLARELRPAVITLDVMMPGMDGWAVLAALKADPALADIPVIMVTIVDDQNLGFALGASDYLTKPIDREQLAAIAAHSTQPRDARPAVLVVEDDRGHPRRCCADAIEKEGWRVAEAENGRRRRSSGVGAALPSLILLDLMMPEMDGFEFLEALRRDGRVAGDPGDRGHRQGPDGRRPRAPRTATSSRSSRRGAGPREPAREGPRPGSPAPARSPGCRGAESGTGVSRWRRSCWSKTTR